MNYASASQWVAKLYAKPLFPLIRLGDCVNYLQYGISLPATEEPVGVPILRMNNLQDDGWDLRDLKYILLSAKDLDTYRLKPGDILFNRTNSKELVGKCEVFREEGDWVFASYLIRVRMDEAKALPDFVSAFLNTQAGRAQIDRVSRQIIGMSNVNAKEIQDLLLPLPPLAVQRTLVAAIEAAQNARNHKLTQAEKLLSGLDGYLIRQLGLKPIQQEQRQVFAVRLGNARNRFDVDYNTPRFRSLRGAIASSSHPVVSMGSICKKLEAGFAAGRNDQAFNDQEGIPHVRPFNITPYGEFSLDSVKYVPRESVGPADLLITNEVLFNNTNSTEWVGKATVFDGRRECACSNHITRLMLKTDLAEPYFISGLLNSFRALGLFGLLSTNFNNQAGINIETLAAVQIPLPSLERQNVIAVEMKKRREEAQRLREEATAEWKAAKAQFEQALLGEGS